jgi:hypothetical protein
MWASQEGGLYELAAAPLAQQLTDPLRALAFDPLEEALWAGSDAFVAQLACPALERFCSVPVASPVVELRALGEAAVSLTAYELAVHASGGAPRLNWGDEVHRGAGLAVCGWLVGCPVRAQQEQRRGEVAVLHT